MKNLKIGVKLAVTFLIIIILFCLTVVAAIYGLKENATKYSEFYNVGYQITNRVMSMRRGMQVIIKELAFITIEGNNEKSDSYLESLQDELATLEENANWVFQNFTSDPDLLEEFATNITAAMEMQENVVNMAYTDAERARTMLLNEYQPLMDEAASALIKIDNIAEKDAERDHEDTANLQKYLVFGLIGVAAVALLITIFLSSYLTGGITRPLRELEQASRKIVEGDFDITIKYKSKDEMGKLADAFRNMAIILDTVISDASMILSEMANGNFDVRTKAEERYVGSFQSLLISIRKLNRDLSATLGQINQSADQVASGSGQVSSGAQALSQGATEQAATVEELASTITGISHQVKDAAKNALEAKEQSNTAGDEVAECNKQMQDMILAMEEITRTSNEINKIVKTIESIAFQTNILALNAAVEASRAGVAGKGFAVVADEVRTLASKSSIASQNTAELIENTIRAVERGTVLAGSTAESLVKVMEEVRVASAKVDMIAEAAEDQADAVEQVTLGMDQISSVVQTNSDTAVESAAASQQLSEQAEVLKNLVAKFILREEYAKGSAAKTGFGSEWAPSPSSTDSINLD